MAQMALAAPLSRKTKIHVLGSTPPNSDVTFKVGLIKQKSGCVRLRNLDWVSVAHYLHWRGCVLLALFLCVKSGKCTREFNGIW